MKKKAFLILFISSVNETATQQLLEFVNKNELASTSYHLIVTFNVNSDGAVGRERITCIYHSFKVLT
jgi:hypothetical protein